MKALTFTERFKLTTFAAVGAVWLVIEFLGNYILQKEWLKNSGGLGLSVVILGCALAAAGLLLFLVFRRYVAGAYQAVGMVEDEDLSSALLNDLRMQNSAVKKC